MCLRRRECDIKVFRLITTEIENGCGRVQSRCAEVWRMADKERAHAHFVGRLTFSRGSTTWLMNTSLRASLTLFQEIPIFLRSTQLAEVINNSTEPHRKPRNRNNSLGMTRNIPRLSPSRHRVVVSSTIRRRSEHDSNNKEMVHQKSPGNHAGGLYRLCRS